MCGHSYNCFLLINILIVHRNSQDYKTQNNAQTACNTTENILVIYSKVDLNPSSILYLLVGITVEIWPALPLALPFFMWK